MGEEDLLVPAMRLSPLMLPISFSPGEWQHVLRKPDAILGDRGLMTSSRVSRFLAEKSGGDSV